MADNLLEISFQNRLETVERLQSKGPRIIQVLTTKLTALMIMLQSYIVGNKLSGQVLQRRTGVLSASIRAIPASIEGTSIVGAVEGAGGPAFYGAVHEYGGSRFYTIMATKARALAFVAGDGQKVFVRPPHMVIHPPARMRAFMAPSLDENAAKIESELSTSIDGVISEP